MRELIINVDDPGERAWDGSSKVFEIKELVRCKDCKFNGSWQKCPYSAWTGEDPNDDGYCAQGERAET